MTAAASCNSITKFKMTTTLFRGSCKLFSRATFAGNCVELHLPLGHVFGRTLFTPVTLGLPRFEEARKRHKLNFVGVEEEFKHGMEKSTHLPLDQRIFNEDIRNLIYLADGPKDYMVIHRVLAKLNLQNRSRPSPAPLRWGALLLRMYHYHKDPVRALDSVQEPALRGIFDNYVSGLILADLLYRNSLLDSILSLHENLIAEKIQDQSQRARFVEGLTTGVFATYYRRNTCEAFERAWNLLEDRAKKNKYDIDNTSQLESILLRQIYFATALALKQMNPFVALKILDLISSKPEDGIYSKLKASVSADIDGVSKGQNSGLSPSEASHESFENEVSRVPNNETTQTTLKSAVQNSDTSPVELGEITAGESIAEKRVSSTFYSDKELEDLLNTDIDSRSISARGNARRAVIVNREFQESLKRGSEFKSNAIKSQHKRQYY